MTVGRQSHSLLAVVLSALLLTQTANAQVATLTRAVVYPTTATAPTVANATGASTFTRFCAAGNVFCVAAIPIPSVNPTTIQFTMWSTTASWVGFGPGTGMSDADVYIGWNSLAGRMIVSDRTCAGYSVPTVDAIQGITVGTTIPAALVGVVPTTARTYVTFTRPVAASGVNKPITTASSYIYAYGTTRPAQDVPTSSFAKHDGYGVQAFDFLTLGANQQVVAAGGPIFTVPNATIIHGIMMTIAWTVCPIAGIFIARYLKDIMGKWWYYSHLGLMLGGATLLSTAGIVFMVLTSLGPHFSLSNPHKPIGLAIGIDSILQAALGFVCNHMWSPDRKSIPWWDRVHWWNGRLLTLLALANIYLGLRLVEAGVAIVVSFFVFVGISAAVLVAGQFFFGQVHHMAKDDNKGLQQMEIGRPYDSNGGYNNGGGGGYNAGGYNAGYAQNYGGPQGYGNRY